MGTTGYGLRSRHGAGRRRRGVTTPYQGPITPYQGAMEPCRGSISPYRGAWRLDKGQRTLHGAPWSLTEVPPIPDEGHGAPPRRHFPGIMRQAPSLGENGPQRPYRHPFPPKQEISPCHRENFPRPRPRSWNLARRCWSGSPPTRTSIRPRRCPWPISTRSWPIGREGGIKESLSHPISQHEIIQAVL